MPDVSNTQIELVFEDCAHENGTVYWYASEFSQMMGYSNLSGFKKVIDRTTKAFIALGIDHQDHIRKIKTSEGDDYKLTRFACYMLAMNGSTKKTKVASAQAYFVEQTRKFELYVQGKDDVERFVFREELKDGNKALSTAAQNSGVTDFAKFTNAGYLGLYNQFNWQLANKRGVGKDKLTDYMGRAELAANLFRVSMTEERLNKEGTIGQARSEAIHRDIAKKVRDQVKENTGKYPEDLPVERRLPEVKSDLKKIGKEFKKIDKI